MTQQLSTICHPNGGDGKQSYIFILASLFKRKPDRVHLIGPRTAMLAVVNYHIVISEL